MNPAKKREFHRWRPAACLVVSGEDAARFLQGQFTNDLQKVRVGDAVYGLWLNQKGKVLADSFIQRLAEQEFRVVSYFSSASVIQERLNAYIIADDVVIDDQTATTAGVTVMGSPPAAEGSAPDAHYFTGRRIRGPHAERVYPLAAESSVLALGETALELSAEEMARRRIQAGIPAVPADIGPTDLPNEGGLELEAISYTKGCYLGQEVMARLKSMGQVRRRLVNVSGPSLVPSVPAPLFQQGRKVGELRSAVSAQQGWIGLALVSLLQVVRADGVSLTIDGPVEIQIATEP